MGLKILKLLKHGLNALILLLLADSLKDDGLDQHVSCLQLVFDETLDKVTHVLQDNALVFEKGHDDDFGEARGVVVLRKHLHQSWELINFVQKLEVLLLKCLHGGRLVHGEEEEHSETFQSQVFVPDLHGTDSLQHLPDEGLGVLSRE